MKLPYTEKVLEHFKNPRNVGEIEDPDGKAVEGSPACGDMVQLTMNVDEKTNSHRRVPLERLEYYIT